MHTLQKILLGTLLFFVSCSSGGQKEPDAYVTFDQLKWAEGYDAEYPHREEMLKDLISHHLLHGMKQDSVQFLLGPPDRTDNGHLFYRISQKKLGLFPLATKTLVIKFTKDSCLEWRKIHG